MKFKIECSTENAAKFAEWIATRGGVASWKSINLGNMGAGWSTPANNKDGTQAEKPTWQASNTPEIVTSTDDVGVYTEVLFKAFPVGLQRGSGFSFNLTDGAKRKLDKAMEQCEEKHGNASYRKGVLDIDGASIGVFYTAEIVSLTEYLQMEVV